MAFRQSSKDSSLLSAYARPSVYNRRTFVALSPLSRPFAAFRIRLLLTRPMITIPSYAWWASSHGDASTCRSCFDVVRFFVCPPFYLSYIVQQHVSTFHYLHKPHISSLGSLHHQSETLVNRCNKISQHGDRDLSKTLHPPHPRRDHPFRILPRPLRSRHPRPQRTQQHLQRHHRRRHRPRRLRRPPPKRRLRPQHNLVQLPPRRLRRLPRNHRSLHPDRRLELDRPGLRMCHGVLAPAVQWQRAGAVV